MKQRLSGFLALFIALFVSVQSYAQETQQTLMLGNYETPDQSQAWDGFNLQNAPFIFAYGHSGSQVIYTAEQLASMKGKEITSLSFKCFTTDDYTEAYLSNAKLYLQEIDGDQFPTNADNNKKLNWVEFNKDNVLAEIDLNLNFLSAAYNSEDVEITFDLSAKPYKYNGKSLVVTVVNDAKGDYPQGTIQFYWIESKKEDPWRSLVYGSDDTDFLTNQSKDIVLNGNEDKWKNAPAAKFTYRESVAPVPPTPTNSTLSLGHFDDQDRSAAWDGFNLQNAPVIFTYGHSGTQVMYTAEQLASMKDKQIKSMTFKCFTEDCYKESYTSNMKMYLQEIDAEEFPYSSVSEQYSWVEFDQNNVAAEMEFSISPLDSYMKGTDIEVKFDLDKPYVYTGKTLVVTIVNDSQECIEGSDGSLRFYWIDSKKEDPWKSFVFASDNITFFENQAKDNVLKALDNEDKWKNAPAVQFAFEGAAAPSDFSGGEGTKTNPYLISSVDDLAQMDAWTNEGKTAGVYFKMTQDITDVPFTGMIGTQANFQGHFDGDYHCVSLDINYPEGTYVGMFCCIEGGSVRNLHTTGTVTGGNYVGVIGQAANGTIVENIMNSCTVNGGMFTGGVIGQVIAQEPSVGCVISQIANYGTVNGGYITGGIIGDSGQQIGNSFKRLVNYGHINCSSKSGGIIGNARPYDMVYYGLNVGTTETDNVAGCIGNTKSSTIGNLYFDGQMFCTSKNNFGDNLNTEDILGSILKDMEVGSEMSEDKWLFADNMYPRLKMNGLENSTLAVLYATPIILEKGNAINNITKPFTVVTGNGVKWASKNGNIKFNDTNATLVNSGADVITASLNGLTRSFNVYVNVSTGICDVIESENNSVRTAQGYVFVELGSDADVKIMDISGKMIINDNLQAGIHSYALSSGIYVVRVNNNTYKVCVSR